MTPQLSNVPISRSANFYNNGFEQKSKRKWLLINHGKNVDFTCLWHDTAAGKLVSWFPQKCFRNFKRLNWTTEIFVLKTHLLTAAAHSQMLQRYQTSIRQTSKSHQKVKKSLKKTTGCLNKKHNLFLIHLNTYKNKRMEIIKNLWCNTTRGWY